MQLGKLTEAETALLPDNDALRVGSGAVQTVAGLDHCVPAGAVGQDHVVLPRLSRPTALAALLAMCRLHACMPWTLLPGQPWLQPAHVVPECVCGCPANPCTPDAFQPKCAQVPNGAAGFYLLGRIHQLSNRHSAAIAYYTTALQLDPMLWSAFEELCALGADHEAQQYLGQAGGSASSRLFSGLAAGTSGGGSGGGGMGGPAAGDLPSPAGFPPVATPSLGQQYGLLGSPSAAAPMSTAGGKSGLGSMFGWMDSGKQRGPPSTARVGSALGRAFGTVCASRCSHRGLGVLSGLCLDWQLCLPHAASAGAGAHLGGRAGRQAGR